MTNQEKAQRIVSKHKDPLEWINQLLAPIAAGTHVIISLPKGYSYMLVKLDEPSIEMFKAAGAEDDHDH
jgi:hypothetical protein